ncbi:MAG: ABC transporter ATP-binding protein/permease [Treponema sp.]|nr:ABC transporter ATP-binding protein/permease [Treponema sp.]
MKLGLILKLLTGKEKSRLAIIFIAQLITGFIELVGIGSIGPFISLISNQQMIHQNQYLNLVYTRFNFTSDRDFIILFGILVIACIVVSNLVIAVVTTVNVYYSEKKRYSITMRLFEQYLRQPYIFFLDHNSAMLMRNLDNVNRFISDILTNILNLVSCSIISLFIIGLLIFLNPLLALIVSAVLGVMYSAIFGALRNFLNKRGKEQQHYLFLRFKYMTEAFGGIKDIKILKKERVFLERLRFPLLKYARNDANKMAVNELPRFLIESTAIGGMVLVILVMIISGSKIEQFLPILTIYAFGAYRLLPLLQRIFRASTTIKYSFPVVETLYNDLATLPAGGKLLYDKEIAALPFNSEIRLKDISFSYPNARRFIINNINLAIKHNTSIAFVGPTGCGKTTLVDIILRLLIPQGGSLSIDGTIIDEGNSANWQKNLGYVPQSIYLTEDSIKNNIAFGVPPEEINMETVIRAAALANIHDFISGELEQGYESSVGERGVKLSGGQRQRIGIARAVYHNPSVLIFDEATSALDNLTENAVMDAIQTMGHKKTIIIIAHRITTVKNCDTIYLMENGAITDSGNFGELYAKNAMFRKMADGNFRETE